MRKKQPVCVKIQLGPFHLTVPQSAGPHTVRNAFLPPRAPVIANSLVSVTPTIDSLLAPSQSVCPVKSNGRV